VIFGRDLRALQHAITKVQPYPTGPIRLANIRLEDAIRRPDLCFFGRISLHPSIWFFGPTRARRWWKKDSNLLHLFPPLRNFGATGTLITRKKNWNPY
jgi:hypothetical protein